MNRLMLCLLLAPTLAFAECPELYPKNSEIVVKGTTELCNSFYVVRYDESKRAAMISAEILRPGTHQVERSNNFRADKRLKNPVVTKDYTNTGFDRGHLTPAGDATTPTEMSETFLMSNMTPQSPNLNQFAWKELETSIRAQVKRINTPVHVVTGAVYKRQQTANGIPIPTGYFKIVYLDPIVVFYADNADNAEIKRLSLPELRNLIGSEYNL